MSSPASADTSRRSPSCSSPASSEVAVVVVYHHEDVGCEPLDWYTAGGLHPTKLDTILHGTNASYRIINKLGSGSFSTVWLARYLDETRWAALKICRADSPPLRELEMLRYLNARPAAAQVPALLDTFTIDGPNGSHTVIVTDVVEPMEPAIYRMYTAGTASIAQHTLKAMARSAVSAVARLHASGVIHGDLHLYNMALAALELNQSDDPAYAEFAADADVFRVFSSSSHASCLTDVERNPKLPMYIVLEIELSEYRKSSSPFTSPENSPSDITVKLLDFGSARHISDTREEQGICQRQIYPPEWLLDKSATSRTSTMASDVWALGLAIYRIMAPGYRAYPGHHALSTIAQLLGFVPASWASSDTWQSETRSKPIEPSAAQADELWAQRREEHFRSKCVSDDDAAALVRLLRRILVPDPATRPSAADILEDPWFATP